MHKFTIFTVLSVFFLSALVASLPSDHPLDKRSYNGIATWFHPGLGACGGQNSDSDDVLALSSEMYASGANCYKWVTVTNTANGWTGSGQVVDLCQGCGADDLDLSPHFFQNLGGSNAGTLSISWNFD